MWKITTLCTTCKHRKKCKLVDNHVKECKRYKRSKDAKLIEIERRLMSVEDCVKAIWRRIEKNE